MLQVDKNCFRHPHRGAIALCFKYGRAMCSDCIACRDPDDDCEYRSGCLIWDLTMHGLVEETDKAANGG